ncbi:MAG: hypothetical protein GY755_17650 [Chloroflexi bacterium]|nr:hypothetical protein [Chloroflexota bacterium]
MTRNRSHRNKQSFITLVFVSAIATAIVGDKIPFAPLFSQAFPVFADFGTVLVEEGYFTVFTEEPTPTIIPATPMITPEESLPPTLTATQVPKTPTLLPTPVIQASPTATPTMDCPAALSSRLEAGMKVIVKKNLNFRSSPEFRSDNLLFTHLAGTILEVEGEVFCSTETEMPYLWRKLKTPEGIIGWSAEASVSGSFYFLEPVE